MPIVAYHLEAGYLLSCCRVSRQIFLAKHHRSLAAETTIAFAMHSQELSLEENLATIEEAHRVMAIKAGMKTADMLRPKWATGTWSWGWTEDTLDLSRKLESLTLLTCHPSFHRALFASASPRRLRLVYCFPVSAEYSIGDEGAKALAVLLAPRPDAAGSFVSPEFPKALVLSGESPLGAPNVAPGGDHHVTSIMLFMFHAPP